LPPAASAPGAGPHPPPAPPLARSAGLAGAATLASRVLGLARETIFAAYFGAGDQMDAFYVAFRIPNLVRDLFAEGAMSAAFVPAFTRHLAQRGRDSAWRLASQVLTALLLATLALVVLGIVFATPIIHAYAGAYAAVPGKLELTVRLTRIVLPFLSLVAVAAVLMGVLNSLHHYFVPSLSPAMFNVAMIASVVVLVPAMTALGWAPVTAVAVGAIAGGLGQVAFQWPAARREGFRYRPALDLADPDLRQVLLLMGPGVLGVAATQVNLFVTTQIATGQGTGAASWLSYAFRLMYFPIGIFGVSIATATLPAVSRHAALADRASVRGTLSHALRLMLALNVPATAGLFVLATPIVRLLFEHGRFQPADTVATAAALRLYALGLVGYSTVRIASPVFYALGRSRIPVLVSVLSIATNLVASLALVGSLGFRALALATSLAALVNAAALLVLLRVELRGLDGRRLAAAVGRIAAATAIMAAVAAGVHALLVAVLPGAGIAAQGVRLGAAIALALASLAAAARWLGLDEFDEALAAVRARPRP
jgi:putative peptidoglycan lipid II flippase